MEKLGCVFNRKELMAIFKKYDKDGCGTIDYNVFS